LAVAAEAVAVMVVAEAAAVTAVAVTTAIVAAMVVDTTGINPKHTNQTIQVRHICRTFFIPLFFPSFPRRGPIFLPV
jgi:hypothetical protein